LFAQDYRATIAGYVTRRGRAAVAEARCALSCRHQPGHRATRIAKATIPARPRARHVRVEVVAKGFQEIPARERLAVVAQKWDLDFKLDVAASQPDHGPEEVDAIQTADASAPQLENSTMPRTARSTAVNSTAMHTPVLFHAGGSSARRASASQR